ncbi:MAG: VWA domain-containing protein, partial [Acidobacteriota bacterium]
VRYIFITFLLVSVMLGGNTLLAQDIQQRKGFSVKITEPAEGSYLFGKVRISADVQIDDPQYLDRVEFFAGDKLIFVDRDFPFQCYHNFGSISKSWVIRVVAYHREDVSVSDFLISRKLEVHYTEYVNRVILNATIVDKNGIFVKELQKEDLILYEDGVPQKILDFYNETRPILMALLIDTSGSMQDNMKEVQKAACMFIDTLRNEDQALVIDFDEKVFLLQGLTSKKDALKEAINSTTAIGGTAIYDALHAAYRKLNRIDGRKAIILLSDGEDTESLVDFKRIIEEAKVSDATIYSIGLGLTLGTAGRSVLREFAEETGGKAFFTAKASELESIYESIADELRMQYYITYFSAIPAWEGQWVKLKAEAKNKDYAVRTKKGFFAVRKAILQEEEASQKESALKENTGSSEAAKP